MVTRILLSCLVILLIGRFVDAQSTIDGNNQNYTVHVNPALAGLLIAFICGFMFVGFFSIYLRSCNQNPVTFRNTTASTTAALATVLGRRPQGLDRSILETFPTMRYEEVKNVKAGKGVLECAICLSEFSDSDVLRLLPQCSHVFHVDCIDVWLESKVTCPVCRANLSDPSAQSNDSTSLQETESQDIEMGERAVGDFRRWHSTGHQGELVDRFTLRLPESVMRGIMEGTRFRRAASVVEERRWFRRWGSGGAATSGRWGFLLRTISGRGAAAQPERAAGKRVFPAGEGVDEVEAGSGSSSKSVTVEERV